MIWEINCIVTCNTNWKTDVKCFIQVDFNYVEINPSKLLTEVMYILVTAMLPIYLPFCIFCDYFYIQK